MKRISRREAAGNFDALVAALAMTKEPVMVEDGGRVVAVVLSPEEFEAWERESFLAMLEQIHRENADKDSEGLERDIARAVEEVRSKRYERERARA